MMSDERLVMALKRLGVPFERGVFSGRADTYITFFLLDGNERFHADDSVRNEEDTYRIDVFSRTDYTQLIRELKREIRNAGFYGVNTGPEMYEDDTKLFHMPVEASCVREDDV